MIGNDLATRKTVSQMVDAFNLSMEEIAQGYKLLESAQKRLEGVFGNSYNDFSTIDHYFRGSHEETVKYIREKAKCSAWKQIINLLGLRKLFSVKRAEEIDRSLEFNQTVYNARMYDKSLKSNVPDINQEAVINFIVSVAENSDDMAREAITEVFNGLKRYAYGMEVKKLKTNEKNAKFDIGKKLILAYMLQLEWSGKLSVVYENQKFLVALERVFRMLDGKPIPDGYICQLVDGINSNNTGKTEYFKYKAHKNRRLHIEFIRLDLLEKLNQIGAGQSYALKG